MSTSSDANLDKRKPREDGDNLDSSRAAYADAQHKGHDSGKGRSDTAQATKQLEAHHVLPKVSLDKSHPGGAEKGGWGQQSQDRGLRHKKHGGSDSDTALAKKKPGAPTATPGEKADPNGKVPEKKDWTIGVEFSTNLPGEHGGPTLGGDHKSAELRRLVAQTKGKSINIMVHVQKGGPGPDQQQEQPDPRSCPKTLDSVSDALSSGSKEPPNDKPTTTERYLIHDGKIEKLPDAHYATPADDLKGLVQDMGTKAPSDKVGVVIQSHGAGADGILTDHGPATLEQTTNAIRDGLKGSGHDKLDLLDYDSCLMGDTKVLDASAGVAKDIVASSSEELGSRTADGQNLNASMKALMNNTKMSGKELGEKIVEQANEGKNGRGNNDSTPTLTNFDMDKYGAFKDSLDKFGIALKKSGAEDGNGALLRSEIDATKVPGKIDDALLASRDLEQLANKVNSDLDAGKFKGDTSDLKKATRDILDRFNDIATKRHADEKAGFADTGGLSTRLPGTELLDAEKTSADMNPLKKIASIGDPESLKTLTMKDKPRLMETVGRQLDESLMCWGQRHPKEMEQIGRAYKHMAHAKDAGQLKRDAENIHKIVEKIEKTKAGEEISSRVDIATKLMQEHEGSDKGSSITPGWDDFVAYERTIK